MFDPSIIFQRTHTGRDEIYQKSHGLTQSERLVLIMVDGASTYQQVREKLPALVDERFERAVRKLHAKELILEVFLPVAGQAPEEIEQVVVDRFLQQDPLDPVTIMFRDPDEEAEYLAQFAKKAPRTSVSGDAAAAPAAEQGTATPIVAATTVDKPATIPVSIQDIDLSDIEVLHDELVEQFSRELQSRQIPRPEPRIRQSKEGRRAKTGRSVQVQEAGLPATASLHWNYILIALGIAVIAGFILTRLSA